MRCRMEEAIMPVEETKPPNLAELEEAVNLAARATQAAENKVAELESQLGAARRELETAKEHEMDARRAFVVAKEAQGGPDH